jgi:hypothetical protein
MVYCCYGGDKRIFLMLDFSGPHAQVKAEEDAVENGIDAPKIEEKVGGVPSGLTTDSEVVQRY